MRSGMSRNYASLRWWLDLDYVLCNIAVQHQLTENILFPLAMSADRIDLFQLCQAFLLKSSSSLYLTSKRDTDYTAGRRT